MLDSSEEEDAPAPASVYLSKNTTITRTLFSNERRLWTLAGRRIAEDTAASLPSYTISSDNRAALLREHAGQWVAQTSEEELHAQGFASGEEQQAAMMAAFTPELIAEAAERRRAYFAEHFPGVDPDVEYPYNPSTGMSLTKASDEGGGRQLQFVDGGSGGIRRCRTYKAGWWLWSGWKTDCWTEVYPVRDWFTVRLPVALPP